MEDITCWESKFESCEYSKKLLNTLISLNERTTKKIDLQEIKKAIYYVRKYSRDNDTQLYSSALKIAYMISEHIFKVDIIVTAILYGAIQNVAFTNTMIKEIFGSIVASQIEELKEVELGKKNLAVGTIEHLWHHKRHSMLLTTRFNQLQRVNDNTVITLQKIKDASVQVIHSFICLAGCLEVVQLKRDLINLCCKHLGVQDLCERQKKETFALMWDDVEFFSLVFEMFRTSK